MVERSGGVPLFVEELTRSVLESGDAKLTGREIPATLHDSLMARLDRLGPAKEVAQVGAVIGGEFSYDIDRGGSSDPGKRRVVGHGFHRVDECNSSQTLV